MGLSNLITPVASPDRDDGQLGQDDGSTDSRGHLFRALHSQTNMPVVVSDGNKSLKQNQLINIKYLSISEQSYTMLYSKSRGHLKPGALTSPGLLLDRHDLQHLILQG